MIFSALQQDSEARIARYQSLRDEAVQSDNTKMVKAWQREISDELKTLRMIVRVEWLNATGELEGYMEQFRARHRSKDLIAI